MQYSIYIDPGHGESAHGLYDPGAVGTGGTKENDVAFDVAKRLAHLLREKGITVYGNSLTATADRESLVEAVHAANAAHVNLYVSLHCNSSVEHTAHGFEVLYASSAGKNAAAIVSHAIAQQITSGQSKWLQHPVNLSSRGIKERKDLYVLTHTTMPAILVEMAFVSNATEERLLNDNQFREGMAQAIADGIAQYLGG